MTTREYRGKNRKKGKKEKNLNVHSPPIPAGWQTGSGTSTFRTVRVPYLPHTTRRSSEKRRSEEATSTHRHVHTLGRWIQTINCLFSLSLRQLPWKGIACRPEIPFIVSKANGLPRGSNPYQVRRRFASGANHPTTTERDLSFS